ncbi:MAG: hypothetical protein HDR03_13285 [Lachnospiraceae bacterium]|nr:hypothetical protein [Lachnospiraceae bacterium]
MVFSSPTAAIALISAIIALLAYKYQRRVQKKYNAFLIAKKYAKEMIPRMRIIKKILKAIGANDYIAQFEDVKRFDSSELNEILQKNSLESGNFKKLLQNITLDIWKEALLENGSDFCNQSWYNMLSMEENIDSSILSNGFESFVHDFLNDLETMALALRYNIADEKLIYQSLHQTYLNHIRIWYYFIAFENLFGENRYYENIVWLYHKWYERKEKQKKKFEKQVGRMTVATKV